MNSKNEKGIISNHRKEEVEEDVEKRLKQSNFSPIFKDDILHYP